MSQKTKLGELSPGSKAKIVEIGGEGFSFELIQRLMEMGFLRGSLVEVIHEAPLSRDPVAVRVRGTLIALRRHEANAIEVVLYE